MIGAYAAMSIGLTCFACAVRGWRFPLSPSRRFEPGPAVDTEQVGPTATATGDHNQAVSGKTAVLIGEKADFRRAVIHISSPVQGKASTAAHQPATGVPAAAQQIGDDHGRGRIDPAVRPLAPVSIAPRLPRALREKDRPLRGRDILVRQLVARLQPPHDQASLAVIISRVDGAEDRRTVLLHGPAGCGKTAIAEQVAYEAAEAGVDVWWVDAVDQATVDASMYAVASLVGVSGQNQGQRVSAADALWRSLRSRDRPWLLVVDGVDDASLLTVSGENVAVGTGWLRPLAKGPGLVLATSRDSTPSRWGDWWDRRPVRGLEPEDGALILHDYTVERAGSKADAQALSMRLSGLPLALKLAGAYLSVTANSRYPDPGPATFGDYKQALEHDRLYHLPSDEQNIVGIWELSVDLLERRGLRHARSLLQLLCCLADAPIPDQLVLDPAVLAASGLFNGLDGTSLQLTVDSLADLQLIDLTQPVPSAGADEQMSRTSRPALVIIHPLIRYAIRHFDQGPESVAADLTLAARLLHAGVQLCGEPDDHRSSAGWHALAPHCAHLLRAIGERAESGIPADAIRLAALAALQAACYLSSSRVPEQAETEFRAVLDVLHKLPGDNTIEILNAREGLACVLRDRGYQQYPQLPEEAEYQLRAICAERQHLLADDQTDATGKLRQLGRVGWDTPEGLALLSGKWDTKATEPVSEMLDSYRELAIALAYQDQNSAEAKAIYQSVYEAQKRLLGDIDPRTLSTRTGLAARLYYEGRLEEAEREFRTILEAEKRIPSMGPDDPSTLVDHGWLANTLYDLGRLEEAEHEYRSVSAARTRILGPEHWETRHARRGLASVLVERGRRLSDPTMFKPGTTEGAITMTGHDAKRELEQALASFEEALGLIDGDQDPGFYGTISHDIGDTHAACGDLQQAAAAYREAVTYKRKRLPGRADDLAVTMEVLCDCLIDSGELTEAQATLNQLEEVLPQITEPVERAVRVHRVGRAYERLAGRGQEHGFSEARRAYTEAAGLVDRDKDPSFYGVIMHDIGDTHAACGDLQQAAAAYREAVTYKRKRLPHHPDDLALTMEALCGCLIESGELTEARTIVNQLLEILPQIADPAERAVHMYSAGEAYQRLARQGQEHGYSEALRAYKNALELLNAEADPGSYATVLNRIGDVHKAQGQLTEARAAYEQAVDQMRHVPNQRDILASMLLDLGRIQRRIGIRPGKERDDKDGDQASGLVSNVRDAGDSEESE